jgi:glycosyltransferase involved in cell wall biosynthesis
VKILFIHNYHRLGSSSGDDIVVNNEIQLLRTNGNEIVIYAKSNSEFQEQNFIHKFINLTQIPWSWQNFKTLQRIIKKEDPDIIHSHTFFPFITPSAYFIASEMGKPIIQTLHDFYFFCPQAFFFKNGQICERCSEKGLHNAILNRCFKNSFIKSSIPVITLSLIKNLNIIGKITAFITFTKFGKSKFSQLGIPSDRIFIKPHFLPDIDNQLSYGDDKYGKNFLFLGRLGDEKGIEFLIDVWQRLTDIPLVIVGSGPLEASIRRQTENMTNVKYIGFISHDDIFKELKKAYAVIAPSLCYETFNLSIVEAYTVGTPVIATNLGAMADLVIPGKTGLLFERNNKEELIEKVKWLWENKEERDRMGTNARKEFEEKYTAEKNYKMLMNIYEKAIEMHKKRK